eukprot:INCI3614.9.p1 GENE.INCI3614.9~~INCI3614.9.p1  ORF type:complete len:268 (+),score=34.69 INCI3614.9:270-1073(+)
MNRFLQAPLSLRFGLSHLKRSRWQSFEYRSRLQSLCVRHFGGASPDSDSKRKGGPTKGGDRIRSLLSSGRGNSLDEKGANLSKADIVRRLQKYVWPAADDPDVPNVAGVKARVIGSVALLIASKAVLIQVPYFFKRLIDTMGTMEENSELAEAVSAVATSETGVMLTAVPLACVLGYGMSRAMASIFSEVRNGVFAVVSLQAVTSLGRQVFEHLHALDLGFHLNRETGAVTRIMQRGTSALNWILTALVFNVIPTVFEVALVNGILM